MVGTAILQEGLSVLLCLNSMIFALAMEIVVTNIGTRAAARQTAQIDCIMC